MSNNQTLLSVTVSKGSTTLDTVDVTNFPTHSSVSCAFESQSSSYSVFYNSTAKTIDIYENGSAAGSHFTLKKSTAVKYPIDLLEAFTLAGNIYFTAYDTSSKYINFYALNSDFSVSEVYSGYIGNTYTMIKPLAYRNSVFFMAYDHTSGDVSKYQIMSTSNHPIYITQVWSDTWAKQWHRFAFFQYGGENFFIKANTLHSKVNIDHLEDDLIKGSHPVLDVAAPADMLSAVSVKTYSDNDGNAFFVEAQPGGSLKLNQVHPSCRGWTELTSNSDVQTSISSVLPYKVADKYYILVS